jgi:hypothetical protein
MEQNEEMAKRVQDLTPEDLNMFPVWEYDLDEEASEGRDETWVRRVESYPVTDLANKVIGVLVTLHNGTRMVACMGNVALNSEVSTGEFLTLSLWYSGEWIDLARYFDVDYAERGPQALSRSLGLPVEQVFPITYNISEHAQGLDAVLRGSIGSVPEHRLSEDERMRLILDT